MTTAPASQPFRRRSHDRLLGGICGAVADRTGVDVGIIRLIAVLLSVLGGVAIPAYLAAWPRRARFGCRSNRHSRSDFLRRGDLRAGSLAAPQPVGRSPAPR